MPLRALILAASVACLTVGSAAGESAKTSPAVDALPSTIMLAEKKQPKRGMLPDLTVRRLWLDDQCRINVVVANSGKQPIARQALGRSTLSFREGKQRAPFSLGKVDPRGALSRPGGTVSFRSQIVLKKRAVLIAIVDSRNAIREINEGNNAVKLALNQPCVTLAERQTRQPSQKQPPMQRGMLPDLTVQRIWLDDQCRINVQIANSGKQPIAKKALGRSTLSLRQGKQRVPFPIGKLDPRGALSRPGGAVSFQSRIVLKRRTVITAVVDSRNTIQERDELNNAVKLALNQPCLTLAERKAREPSQAKPGVKPPLGASPQYRATVRDPKVAQILQAIDRADSLDDLRRSFGRELRITADQHREIAKVLDTEKYRNRFRLLQRTDPAKLRLPKALVVTKAESERRARENQRQVDVADRQRELGIARQVEVRTRAFRQATQESLAAARAQSLQMARRWGAPVTGAAVQRPELDYTIESVGPDPATIGQTVTLRSAGRGFGNSIGKVGLLFFDQSSSLIAALDLTDQIRSWSYSAVTVRIPQAVADILTDQRRDGPSARIWVRRADAATEGTGAFAAIEITPDPYLLNPEIASVSETELTTDSPCFTIRGRNFLSTYEDDSADEREQEVTMGEMPPPRPPPLPHMSYVTGGVIMDVAGGGRSIPAEVSPSRWSNEDISACAPNIKGVQSIQFHVTVRTRTNKHVTYPQALTYRNTIMSGKSIGLGRVEIGCWPWILELGAPFGGDASRFAPGPVQWQLCVFGDKKTKEHRRRLYNDHHVVRGEFVTERSNGLFPETQDCGAHYFDGRRPREGEDRVNLKAEFWVNAFYYCEILQLLWIRGPAGVPHDGPYDWRETMCVHPTDQRCW